MRETLQERVTRRLAEESACLVWQGARDKNGYGIIQVDGRPEKVHRVVWFISHGPIPRGLVVRHAVCDNPPCCRLEHLAIGTHKDNADDRVGHGRQRNATGDQHGMRRHPEARRHGEANGASTISDSTVERIGAAHQTGMFTQREIARFFGISQSHVGRIVRGESRSHRWLRRPQETQA